MTGALALRAAVPLEAGALGEILHGCAAATPWLPQLYTGAEAIGLCGQMIDRGWVTVAAQERRVLGFLAREGAYVHALYVRRGAEGRGIGRCLLDEAKARTPRLRLWTCEANLGARRFYRREGFAETARGCGAGNDAGLPDVRYDWQRSPAR